MTTTATTVAASSASASLVHALDLVVRRRVENLLAGDHASTTLGPGTELAQVRPYEPGDDVRFIDWAVTARTNTAHVRIHVAERSLTTWLVLDASPSMRFGTAERTKAQVAEGVALTIGHLATRGSNRLAITTFGGGRNATVPPAQGRSGLLHLLHALRTSGADTPDGSGEGTLADALTRTARFDRQRGLVVVVADWRGSDPSAWRQPMLALTARHDVVAIEIRDQREQELPNVGELWLVDPETGRQLRVDTRDRKLRARFADAAAQERATLAGALASAGADHLVVSTQGDWLQPLATHLLQRKHRCSH